MCRSEITAMRMGLSACPQQQRRRDGEAEGLRGLEADHQLELGRLLDREVGGLRAVELVNEKRLTSARNERCSDAQSWLGPTAKMVTVAEPDRALQKRVAAPDVTATYCLSAI